MRGGVFIFNEFLCLSAVIALVCVMMVKFGSKFGVPSLILFIGLGMALGSDGIFKIHFDNFELSEKICTVALIYIMFYGGFCMNWESAKKVALKAGILSTVGIVLTTGIVGIFAHYVLKMSLLEGMLIGAVLASTDAASVFNILRMKKLNLKEGMAPLLEMESGSNDPFAYMLTVIILSLMSASSFSLVELVLRQIGFGVGFGFLCGYVGYQVAKYLRFKDVGRQTVFVVGVALLSYALPSMLQGNGFLSVYITGMILGNVPLAKKVEVVHFFDTISQIMQMVLFFLLGLLAFPSQIPQIIPTALAIMIFLTFIARPVTVWLCMLPFSISFKELIFLSWSGLRGAASIVFAIMTVVSPAYTQHDIFHIVFFVALLSITIQGGFLPKVAKLMDIEDQTNNTMKTFTDYIENKPLELVQIEMDETHPWANHKLEEVTMASNMLIVGIQREEEIFYPKGDTRILPNDLLIACVCAYEGEDIYLEELYIRKKHPWIGKTMQDVNEHNRFLVTMIKRHEHLIVPKGDTQIEAEDILVYLDRKKA